MTIYYAELVERNDWEGESWTFWIQHTGNEAQLELLYDRIEEQNRTEEYSLDLDNLEPEEIVDRIVRRTRSGYMDYQNKVSGRFTCPEDVDDLYKGRAENFMEDW